MTQRVLFVCTGNICRSPAAEVLFAAAASHAQVHVQVASAGTGAWHVGQGPTAPNLRAARRAGFDMSAHRAQQFAASHFDAFNWIIGMTREHVAHIEALRPAESETKVRLFSSFSPDTLPRDFPDPYGQEDRRYEAMWRQLEAAMPALVQEIGGA